MAHVERTMLTQRVRASVTDRRRWIVVSLREDRRRCSDELDMLCSPSE